MATFYVPKGTTDLTSLSITDNCDIIVTEGGQDIVSGVDLSGLATGVHLLDVQAPFHGDIGSPASPFRADIDAGSAPKIQYGASGGTMYFYPGGGSSSATEIECIGNGRLVLSTGGTVVSLEVGSGSAYIPDVVNVTNLRMDGGTVTQLYKSTQNTSWHIDGGVLNTGRGFSGTAYVFGGAEVNVKRVDTGATLPTGATLIIGDGHVKWMGGALTAVVLGVNGTIDLSEAPLASTVGSVTGSARALSRSRLQSKYAAGLIAITTENEYIGSRVSRFASMGGVANGIA